MKNFIIFGLFFLVLITLAESQRARLRNNRRFSLRGRPSQNPPEEAEEEAREEALQESEPLQSISESVTDAKVTSGPSKGRGGPRRRPATVPRRPARRRPSQGRRPALPPAEVTEEKIVEAVPQKVPQSKQSGRRGLRVRIPKRPEAQPEEDPVLTNIAPEKNEEVPETEKEVKAKQNLRVSSFKPRLNKKMLTPEISLAKEDMIEADPKIKEDIPPSVNLRPLPLRISKSKSKKAEIEKKVEVIDKMTEATQEPLEENSPVKTFHRFQTRRRPNLKARARVKAEESTPKIPAEIKIKPEEKIALDEPQIAPINPRRKAQARFNRRRPSKSRKQATPEEEAQTKTTEAEAEKEADPVLEDPAPLQIIQEQPDDKRSVTTEANSEVIDPDTYITLNTSVNEESLLSATQSPFNAIFDDSLFDLLNEGEETVRGPLRERVHVPIEEPSNRFGGKLEKGRTRNQSQEVDKNMISRRPNKMRIRKLTSNSPPLILPEDPKDQEIPSTFPVHRYSPPDITFDGGEVVITEIGTIEDTPLNEVKAILAGLGSRRRGLSRYKPQINTYTESHKPRFQDEKPNTDGQSEPDLEYVYEYYDELY